MARGNGETSSDFLPQSTRATSGSGIPGRTNTTVTDADEQINQIIALLSEKAYRDHVHDQYLTASLLDALPITEERVANTVYVVGSAGNYVVWLWANSLLVELASTDKTVAIANVTGLQSKLSELTADLASTRETAASARELSVWLTEQFNLLTERIAGLNAAQQALSTDLQGVNDHLHTVEVRVDGISQEVATQRDAVSAVESRMDEVDTAMTEVRSDLTTLQETVDNIDLTGADATVDADITVAGVTVGNLTNGTVLAQGTSMSDVLRAMLVKRIAATYTAPTLAISGTGATSAEVGTSVSVVITPSFSKNDGGDLLTYLLQKNGTAVATEFGAYSETITLTSSAISFAAQATYAAGAIKNDNLGDPSPAGAIQAGSCSSGTKSYTGYRRAFFGPAASYATSAAIRALSYSANAPAVGTSLVFTGTGASFVWAYPATLQNPTSLGMVSNGFAFNLTPTRAADVMVNDASGANPVAYKVFVYAPTADVTDAVFTLKI